MALTVRVGAVLAVLTAFSCLAHAQNLVQNPGFEDSTSSTSSPGWTLGSGGGTIFDSGQTAGPALLTPAVSPQVSSSNPNANTGLWDVSFGSTDATTAQNSTLSQTITTVPGQTYLVTFFLMNTAGPHNTFLATFGGQTVLSLSDANPFGYTQFSYQVTATGKSTVLAFTGEQDPGFFYLDDVSVEAAPAPAVGGGLLSAGFVLAGLGFRCMRRRFVV